MSPAPVADRFERAVGSRWESVLAGIRADALDCLQSTLALVADDAYGTGAHLALGARWRFPARGEDGTAGVQPSLAERMDDASLLLGFRVGPPEEGVRAPELWHMARAAPLYVIAEAYDLQWLPYARSPTRYREMPHSFLLEAGGGACTVVDGYYADTEWGRARPAVWKLPEADLETAVEGEATAIRLDPAGTPPRADRDAALARNAAAARAAAGDIDSYIEAVRAALGRPEGIERLVLDIWHLLRERLLHTYWLGDDPAAAGAGASVQEWQRLAAQSYLAIRRVRRGAPPNAALVDDMARLLHSDAEFIGQLAPAAPSPTAPDADTIARAVRDSLRAILPLDGEPVDDACPLRSLPGFDSFRLVEIIDRIEATLGVRFPADAPSADLADVAGLCRLFAGAAGLAPDAHR